MSFRNNDYDSYDGDMPTLASLPPQFVPVVENELDDNEKCVWADQPIPHWFSLASLGPFLFAIPWTAFSVFWIFGAAGFKIPDFSEPQGFFCLFGVPFLLVGIGMLSSPYWMRRKMKRTVYAVTDRRVIVFEGGVFSSSVRSYMPNELTELYRTQNAKGIGSISFVGKPAGFPSGRHAENPFVYCGFQNIRNVKAVESLLRNLTKNSQDTDNNI